MEVYAVSARQMAQGHTPCLFDKLYDGLIVFGDYEDCSVAFLPVISKVLARIEGTDSSQSRSGLHTVSPLFRRAGRL